MKTANQIEENVWEILYNEEWYDEYIIKYNNVYYEVNLISKDAAVTHHPNAQPDEDGPPYPCYNSESEKYSGDIIISSEITFHGEKFPVVCICFNAFFECQNLNSVIIPDGIKEIGGDYSFLGAFWRCTNLKSIFIPKSVTYIDEGILCYSYNLESIIVDKSNPSYNDGNGKNCIIETKTKKLIAGCKNTIIPKDVKVIGHSAFKGCSQLESIVIPESVCIIERDAFAECPNLKSIIRL